MNDDYLKIKFQIQITQSTQTPRLYEVQPDPTDRIGSNGIQLDSTGSNQTITDPTTHNPLLRALNCKSPTYAGRPGLSQSLTCRYAGFNVDFILCVDSLVRYVRDQYHSETIE